MMNKVKVITNWRVTQGSYEVSLWVGNYWWARPDNFVSEYYFIRTNVQEIIKLKKLLEHFPVSNNFGKFASLHKSSRMTWIIQLKNMNICLKNIQTALYLHNLRVPRLFVFLLMIKHIGFFSGNTEATQSIGNIILLTLAVCKSSRTFRNDFPRNFCWADRVFHDYLDLL